MFTERNIINSIPCHFNLCRDALDAGGKIALVSSTLWLHIGTVRDNILFGQAYDDERYRETLRVCALDEDMGLLPNGAYSAVHV